MRNGLHPRHSCCRPQVSSTLSLCLGLLLIWLPSSESSNTSFTSDPSSLAPCPLSEGCEIRSGLSGKSDREVLLFFKSQLVGRGEPALQSWGDTDLSLWRGVRWGEDEHVVKLDLSGVGLQGQIFAFWQELHQLTTLDLSQNLLNGSLDMARCTQDPDSSNDMMEGASLSELPTLSKLKMLNLSHNLISGEIPPHIFGLQQLTILDLSQNNLTGKIFIVSTSSSALETLDLSSNKLSGALLFQIENLHSLKILNASKNLLTGVLPPWIGQLKRLEILDLSSNQLVGELPPSIFDLANLIVLNLAKNNLTGDISHAIGRLNNLSILDLCSNHLTGKLPVELGNCSRLENLKLTSNTLSGSIPHTLANLSQLKVLSLGINNLYGSFDLNLSGFSMLEEVYLANNFLSGPLPMELGHIPNLKRLVFHKNQFHGSIPESLGNCSQLEELWLDHNNLSGPIPEELFLLANLKMLVLAGNRLSGAIPRSISNCTKLKVVWLEQNSLSGPVPWELGSLKKLIMVSLAGNYLEGAIPSSLGQIQGLLGLDLGSNNLRGELPDMLAGLVSIQFLFLPHNQLEGPIPHWITCYQYLRAFDLSFNNFTGTLPSDWSSLTAVKVKSKIPENGPSAVVYTGEGLSYFALSLPITLDFSHNHLTGSIPFSLGDLKNLQVLDLSMNMLSGEIPVSLGEAADLIMLDLSNNTLTGAIPLELTELTFLSMLNLSYNSLAGQIPNSGQLSTFSRLSFQGNDELCGLPLEPCSKFNSPVSIVSSTQIQPKNLIQRKLLPLYIVIAGSIGFCGFWVFLFAVLRWGPKFRCSDGNCKEQCLSHYASTFSGLYAIRLNPNELALATDNYSQANIVGDGGFGMVYRAVRTDGSWVAVKKLVTDGTQGEREFLAEMQTLGKVKHKNLVSLLGYARDGNDRILVYKFLKNGSLDTWLHCREEGMKPLDWPTRLKIIHGAAQGICFLHYGCSPLIIHRDIKVSNILLDEYFEAHVADFGLARLMHGDTHVSTDIAGTVGYIPPEYSHICIATTRGDVYSFGVVVLEILTGKRPTDCSLKKIGVSNLVAWIQSLSSIEQASLVIDSSLMGTCPVGDALKLMRVACHCCQEIPGKRPTMKQVVEMIETMPLEKSVGQSPTGEK